MAVEITGSWGPLQHFSVRRNRYECTLRKDLSAAACKHITERGGKIVDA